ncbi:MAG: Uma2 family endonuclease [Pyrinomonadaceae bacterium]
MISSVADFGETLKTTFLNKVITLHGVSWEDYKVLQKAIEIERPRMKMSLCRGKLTILTAATLFHEIIKTTLEGIISLTMMKTRREIIATGQATMRSASEQIATEPDASYFIQNADSVELKNYVADELDLAPDLVVEIEENYKSDDKFEIYAAFGIKEFWLYDARVLRMFELSKTGEYLLIEKSIALPILTGEVLTQFLNRSQTEDQFQVLLDFEKWLQENK